MRLRSKLLCGTAAAIALTIGAAVPASADTIFGDRYCGAPRLAGTSSTAGSGQVVHYHTDLNGSGSNTKFWTNSGVQTRYFAWKEDITFKLTSVGATSAYDSTCDE